MVTKMEKAKDARWKPLVFEDKTQETTQNVQSNKRMVQGTQHEPVRY